MNVFGVGLPEMIIIFVVALLIFGPKKLPEISRQVAKAIKGLQEASKEFETALKQEVATLESPQAPQLDKKTQSLTADSSLEEPDLSTLENTLQPSDGKLISEVSEPPSSSEASVGAASTPSVNPSEQGAADLSEAAGLDSATSEVPHDSVADAASMPTVNKGSET